MRNLKGIKIIKTLALFGLVTFLFASCETQESQLNKTIVEQIKFPTIEFTISPMVDTTIFGPQGTRLFIEKATFQYADGTPVTDSIVIHLKEFYKKSDITMSELYTASNKKILETGGMLNISATSKGKQVQIKDDKRIVVHFPKAQNTYKKMNLFYADKTSTDSSVANWEIDTTSLVKKTLKLGAYGYQWPSYEDSTEYNFTPRNYIDTGYYWNPMELYVNSYNFSKQAMKEIEAYTDIYGVESKMTITTKGEIDNLTVNAKISKATKDEILSFIKKLPKLEPGKNNKGEIIDRIGYIHIAGGNIIPLYKSREEYLKSFDKKYSRYEKQPIKNMDDAELNYYIFSIAKLGWINCDRFLETDKTVDLIVNVPSSNDTKVKMVFKDINGVLMATTKENKYVFSNVPIDKQVTIVAIQNKNGQINSVFKDLTIENKPLQGLTMKETTLGELKQQLEKLN